MLLLVLYVIKEVFEMRTSVIREELIFHNISKNGVRTINKANVYTPF